MSHVAIHTRQQQAQLKSCYNVDNAHKTPSFPSEGQEKERQTERETEKRRERERERAFITSWGFTGEAHTHTHTPQRVDFSIEKCADLH